MNNYVFFAEVLAFFNLLHKVRQLTVCRPSAAATTCHVERTVIGFFRVVTKPSRSMKEGLFAIVTRAALFDQVALYDDYL